MNPFEMLKNVKNLQGQFDQVQEELAAMHMIGSSGGGIVKVTLNGQFELIDVNIDPIAVDPRDVPMLQDLIVAAHVNASDKLKEALKDKFGPMAAKIPGL